MNGKKDTLIRLTYDEILRHLESILIKEGFSSERALIMARIFTDNSLEGKDSHGVNRFKAFVNHKREGFIKADAEPSLISANISVEQWDGNLGPGALNALFCTERAISIAEENELGCVALRNTNHWLRGGTYGKHAAEKGFILICWTNAIPTMPPWGGTVPKLGNNPLVIAIPKKNGNLVLDMALSQYSYGRLESLLQAGEQTDYFAGYDERGNLTKDPAEILKTKRALPIGMWKGAGLSLMLDLIAAILSSGKTSADLGLQKIETGISQIFIAINPKKNLDIEKIIQGSLSDLISAETLPKNAVHYPGELSNTHKYENLKLGIPVNKEVWDEILKM